jgi:hypothetical protein
MKKEAKKQKNVRRTGIPLIVGPNVVGIPVTRPEAREIACDRSVTHLQMKGSLRQKI